MSNDRRTFMKVAAATATLAATALAATSAAAQAASTGQFKGIKALAFDAYGTLFDVFSVTALCEQLFPGKGNQLAQTWRVKQLQYSLLRTTMGRHRDFWGLTEDGLVWATKNLKLDLTPDKKKQLMDAYLSLAAFPDVKPGLEALKKHGLRLAILSNGEPRMLEAAAKRRHTRPARRGRQRRGGQGLQGEPARLQPRVGAAEGDQSRTRLRFGQQLGCGRRRIRRAADVLDPARDGGGAGGTGFPGRHHCQGAHRTSAAAPRLVGSRRVRRVDGKGWRQRQWRL
jgi:HAD superfamily hydrolase (TIGR01493 family)